MRYIITGASGHIGNNLVRMINKTYPDAEVIALTRRKITRELNGARYTEAVGNLEDAEFISENIAEGDIVIHSAGVIDLTDKKQDEMHRINYLMTKLIVDICLTKNVKKFIYIGSVDAIYKDGKPDAITEPAEYFPDKMPTGYGRTKALATEYVLKLINEHPEFNAGIIMPTAVIGINDMKPSEAGKIIQGTLKGAPEFGIKGGYNFVDVRDVCKAILSLAESEGRGQYIISGEDVSVKELYEFINRYKGLKRKPMIIPNCIALLACPFVKILNKTMIEVLQEPHNYSSARAQKELGYKATPIDEVLRNTIDWHEKNIL